MTRRSFLETERDKLRQVYLLPGQIHCTVEPALITTVLGSCVAVCLWDKYRCFGGMNHFVLPRGDRGEFGPRYGDVAIEQLLGAMRDGGSRIEFMTAKIFGGANVLPVNSVGDTVGDKNVRVALELLRATGIPVIAQATGGIAGYELKFYTANGKIALRKLAAKGEVLPKPATRSTQRSSRHDGICGVSCDCAAACPIEAAGTARRRPASSR